MSLETHGVYDDLANGDLCPENGCLGHLELIEEHEFFERTHRMLVNVELRCGTCGFSAEPSERDAAGRQGKVADPPTEPDRGTDWGSW